jgi:hypothetical protein
MDEVDLAEVGLGRSLRIRVRCFTVTPWWASSSTPKPARSRMHSCGGLLKARRALRPTDLIIPGKWNPLRCFA